MATIVKRALGVVDRLYGFVGGIGDDGLRIARTEGGIDFVHDVSREAEIGAGKFWMAQDVQAHVASGSIASTLLLGAPTESLHGYSFDIDQQDAWAMAVWGFVSVVTDYVSNKVSIVSDRNVVGPADADAAPADQLIANFDGTIGTDIVNILTPAMQPTRPQLISASPSALGGLVFFSESGGVTAFSITTDVLIWVGAKGSSPPGMY